jgi:hypothetical protein
MSCVVRITVTPRSAIERLHEVAHGELGDGIEADRRLVEEEHARRVHHAGGDLAAHALAEGELSDGDVEEALEVEEVGQLIFGSFVLVGGDAIDVAEELEAFDDGEVPPELRSLAENGADAGDVADSVAPGCQSANYTVTARWFEDAAEDLEGGRFAGAVRADEAEEFSFCELEADSLEGVDRARAAAGEDGQRAEGAGVALGDAEGLGQVVDDDLGRRHSRSWRAARV